MYIKRKGVGCKGYSKFEYRIASKIEMEVIKRETKFMGKGADFIWEVSELENKECFLKGSTWWRDICKIYSKRVYGNWFGRNVRKTVREANDTKFWSDIWVGNERLESKYIRLCQVYE